MLANMENCIFLDSRSFCYTLPWWTLWLPEEFSSPIGSETSTSGPLLCVGNRSVIRNFWTEQKSVYSQGRKFSWEFVASVSLPIVGADFLCEHGLLVDMANRRLIDVITFATVPCSWGIWANHVCTFFVLGRFPVFSGRVSVFNHPCFFLH